MRIMNRRGGIARWWIVGLLCMVLVPSALAGLPGDTSSSRELMVRLKQEQEDCRNNLTSLGELLKLWRQQYQTVLSKNPEAAALARRAVPPGCNWQGLSKLLAMRPGSEKLLHCPGSKIKALRRNRAMDEAHNCYYYMGNLNLENLSANPAVRDAELPLIFDKAKSHHLTVLFRDGHVEAIGQYGRNRSTSAQELVKILDQRYHYIPELKQRLLEAAVQLDQQAGIKAK